MNNKNDKWKIRRKDDTWIYFNNKEALLLDLSLNLKIEEEILQKLRMKRKPQVIIIDGVDGVGKSTIVKRIKEKLEEDGDRVRFNTFKRRRNDKEEFKEQTKEYEWKFRKEVVEEINKRIVTYKDEEWIIIDKSPYSEYYYQKTKEFDRGLITAYGNHLMEKEIFKYKEIIDNAIVIFLENEECWNNYYNREIKKNNESSYKMLNEKEYRSMVKSFAENQDVYEDTRKYKKIEIRNDDESWEKVYKAIETLMD
jgi:thymidylate kinase